MARGMSKRRGAGEGSIYRQGNRWVASVTIDSTAGRQVRVKRVARTQVDARAKLKELQSRAAAGVAGSGRVTVKSFLEDWLEDVLPSRSLRPATVENYTWAIRHHIEPAIGSARLERLKADDVDKMLRDMAAAGKARSTIRLVRTVLVLALSHAERRDMVVRNVARLSILPAAPARQSRALTLSQARSLLAAASSERLEALWVTMLLTGLRPGEALGLAWEDVDLDGGHLRVRQAVQRGVGGKLDLGEPKTTRSRRVLDLPNPVVEALRSHRSRQSVERLALGPAWTDSGLVFTTTTGTMLDPSNVRRAFSALTQQAGLGHWHPHELRHSTVSLLSAAGVPLEQIADLAGHSTTRVTDQIYRHPVSSSVTAAKHTMEQLFGPKAQTEPETA
jgi:integrase